jgi:hypothetical protein
LQKDNPESPVVGKKQPAEKNIDKDDVDETPLDNYFSWTEDREMFECFKFLPDKECYLNLPDNMVDSTPLDMENIKEQQNADDALLKHATKYVDQYMCKHIGTIDDILCYIKPSDPPNNWKIALQKAYCNQQLSGSTKILVIEEERGYSCKSLVGITTEIYACLLTNSIVNTVKGTS